MNGVSRSNELVYLYSDYRIGGIYNFNIPLRKGNRRWPLNAIGIYCYMKSEVVAKTPSYSN